MCRTGLWLALEYYVILVRVVVLKLASAILYLECRPLDMHTGALEWDVGRYFLRLLVQFCLGL